ncbi:E3 ubiquitin-protein ligase TRIM35-like [Ruditapes philippinarum]|uniref:E3 ubiquitin-protein ligase TRIM35-like n=1 Tax=Ruditapes philippinarum TaxID=129788 RepID=UPI00295B517A|nr:E3 ubiquitin-protein ligase TRIM35-like [Ruditapes philippinarum]
MGKKDRKVKNDVFSTLCDKHQKYTVDLFCVDCDKVICVICQATEHNSRNHKRILTVDDASTKCAETKQFLDYEDKLSIVSKRENEILAENNKVNTITNQLKDETESLIKKHKQGMIDLIEKHYKMLYEKNQLKYEESKKRLQKANEQLYKNKNKTAEIRQEIHDKKESGQNVALFIAMKKSQDNLRQIEIEIEETEKLNFVERYEFQAGHMVRQLLEEEKEFGELLVTPSKSPKGTCIGIYVIIVIT